MAAAVDTVDTEEIAPDRLLFALFAGFALPAGEGGGAVLDVVPADAWHTTRGGRQARQDTVQ